MGAIREKEATGEAARLVHKTRILMDTYVAGYLGLDNKSIVPDNMDVIVFDGLIAPVVIVVPSGSWDKQFSLNINASAINRLVIENKGSNKGSLGEDCSYEITMETQDLYSKTALYDMSKYSEPGAKGDMERGGRFLYVSRNGETHEKRAFDPATFGVFFVGIEAISPTGDFPKCSTQYGNGYSGLVSEVGV